MKNWEDVITEAMTDKHPMTLGELAKYLGIHRKTPEAIKKYQILNTCFNRMRKRGLVEEHSLLRTGYRAYTLKKDINPNPNSLPPTEGC